jgi:hypothetical protein
VWLKLWRRRWSRQKSEKTTSVFFFLFLPCAVLKLLRSRVAAKRRRECVIGWGCGRGRCVCACAVAKNKREWRRHGPWARPEGRAKELRAPPPRPRALRRHRHFSTRTNAERCSSAFSSSNRAVDTICGGTGVGGKSSPATGHHHQLDRGRITAASDYASASCDVPASSINQSRRGLQARNKHEDGPHAGFLCRLAAAGGAK